MNEDFLKQAMHDRVGGINPDRERLYAARVTASERRRRRDTLSAAVAGSAFTVIAFIGAFNIHDFGTNGRAGNGTGVGGSNDPTVINLAAKVEATKPAEATAASKQRSGMLVAASAAGRLVQIDPVSGKTTKVLTVVKDSSDESKGGLLGHVAIESAANVVYFDQAGSDACSPSIASIPSAGGKAANVTAGSDPTVSPNGKSLAFVANNNCDGIAVKVRDLASGVERTVVTGNGQESPTAVANVSWSPDGKTLLLDLRYDVSSSNHLATVSAASKTSFVDAKSLSPSGTDNGTVWEWGAYFPDGSIFVSERCCTSSTSAISNTQSRMLVINPSNPGQTLIAYGVLSKAHSGMGVDPSGRHLFYFSDQDLMVSDDQERPAPLAYGVIGAAWSD